MATVVMEQDLKELGSRGTSPSPWNVPTRNGHEGLPRAASYTYTGAVKDAAYEQRVVEIHGDSDDGDDSKYTFGSESTPALTHDSGATTPDEPVAAIALPGTSEVVGAEQEDTKEDQQDSNLERVITASSVSDAGAESRSNLAASDVSAPPQRPSLSSKSFSRRFSKRESWYQSSASTPSRSPSPVKQDNGDESVVAPVASPQKERRKSLITRTLSGRFTKEQRTRNDTTSSGDEKEDDKPRRPTSFLRRKSTRDGNRLSKVDSNSSKHRQTSELPPPAIPSLPKSFSTDKVPGLTSSSDRAAPTPRLLVAEKDRKTSSTSMNRKKDELWSVFRSLDSDYSKFNSKSSALKANVVRTSLIPFLRTYAAHPSNHMLRPEDLDRRANILNKWWTGLIEMLHGRNNLSISGTDRPIILDGVAGIMERPEWRLSPSPFAPLKGRVRDTLVTASQSSTSLASSSSDFLADSVVHNTKNIFIQNLTAQMGYVIEKMSSRHASASLVAFCGKACAYAFMFVPGMADILSRLWELSMDTIRRVLVQSGIGKFEHLDDTANEIVADFPPALHLLGFTSLMKFMRQLRNPPPLPLGTSHIQWWGPWLERWSGRESDLFYVFVKQFHFLAVDFLPSDLTPRETLRAPGMLLVHAQILANIDATIHRDATNLQQDCSAPATSTTFDDMLGGDPDAVASAIPVLPNNTARVMAENRLVMLIRDFFSDRTSEHPIAREMFALAFNNLLQAAVQGTSMFDHNACYTLLDFLEEALPIMARYETSRDRNRGHILNLDFWILTFKKMIDSQNTLTEIRLYSFFYTAWNVLAPNCERKRELCTRVLLDKDIFESRFNHWCPMVRAYYMRLLCWRVARYEGSSHDGDLEVLGTLHERLQTTWAYHLYLCQTSPVYPVTVPCSPAPGRRFIIVRTDNQVSHANTYLSFDGILRAGESPTQSKEPPWKRASTGISLIDTIEARPASITSTIDSDSDSCEKSGSIGGFLRKMIGSKSRTKAQDAAAAKTSSPHNKEKPATPTSNALRADHATNTPEPSAVSTFRALSFKFSLEMPLQNKVPQPMRLLPPRLPAPAQNCLLATSPKASTMSATQPLQPKGESIARARYSGRALAEWTIVVGECGSFFERRRKEGAPGDADVETPVLGVEVFKRLG